MIGTPEFDEFISKHRWAIVTTLRSNGHPSSSVVAYAREDDTLIISTTAPTLKVKTLEKDPRITLCIINNEELFNFVTIEGTTTIERSDIVESTQNLFTNIEEAGYTEPPELEQWLEQNKRVILRIHPDRVSGVIR
jgi:PPOX class probable F420-dependent enzyme